MVVDSQLSEKNISTFSQPRTHAGEASQMTDSGGTAWERSLAFGA